MCPEKSFSVSKGLSSYLCVEFQNWWYCIDFEHSYKNLFIISDTFLSHIIM